VTEPQPEVRRPETGLDDVLLDVKLSVPRPRPGLVSRRALIDTLRTSRAGAVGVTAPAGYGKSTLLVEWADSERRGVAWISLDRLDDDPSALLYLIASAYERAVPENAGFAAEISGLGVSALSRGAPRLAATFSRAPVPFVLLLDDLQEIRSPGCHDVLSVVLSGIRAGSQVVTASRTTQPHLPRLRAIGDAVELRAQDLALDRSAAEQIFATARVAITPQQAIDVTRRTEGWPVGLHLAAMIARDAPHEAWRVSGDDRYVADYLHQEALSKLDPAMQQFVRRTAVLERLHGPLCDAILQEPGAQERLRSLEESHAFLIPLDRSRGWYRYHPLFREFLLGELRQSDPDLIEKLQVRAADWFEAHGSPAMAIDQLLTTPEKDRCAQLVASMVPATYGAGRISTVQRWMTALGESTITAYPPLAVLAGWVTALVGETGDAQRWVAVADEASFDAVPTDGAASFASSRAMLRAMMCPAGPEQMMVDAEFAVEQETPSSMWRDTALCLLGDAQLLAGDLDRAVATFEDATSAGLARGHTDTVVLSDSELALIAIEAGRWDEAAHRVETALGILEEHRMHDYAISILTFAAAARLALHRADLAEADRWITAGMRTRPASTFVLPFLATRGRLQLAKACMMRGDQAGARLLLREIDDILRRRPLLGATADQVSDFRATVAMTSAGVPGVSPLTSAELRLLPYLQTHLTVAEIAQRLQISRNTVGTQVTAIYRKLGVSSRGEAVGRAITVGLLGG
jgi:LuxR family transcriptional regulator, maltose regulon positive regulatory protein